MPLWKFLFIAGAPVLICGTALVLRLTIYRHQKLEQPVMKVLRLAAITIGVVYLIVAARILVGATR